MNIAKILGTLILLAAISFAIVAFSDEGVGSTVIPLYFAIPVIFFFVSLMWWSIAMVFTGSITSFPRAVIDFFKN